MDISELNIIRCSTHELNKYCKHYLKDILKRMHAPENFDLAVDYMQGTLSWNTLHYDWDNLSIHERGKRWNLFCEDIIRAAYKTRPYCIRCGDCCKKAPPTLHHQDKTLFDQGILQKTDVFTLRKGELVHSGMDNTHYPLKEEMIKVKEKPGTKECIFLTHSSCSIYEYRPLQCKNFECWSTQDLIDTFKQKKLTRKDIVKETEIISEIIDYHEKRCSYASLKEGFRQLEKEGIDRTVLDILSYDTALRTYIQEKLALKIAEMGFYFGRAFQQTVKMFGYRIRQDKDARFVLEYDG
jgi:Fe-S-cluster containining protein